MSVLDQLREKTAAKAATAAEAFDALVANLSFDDNAVPATEVEAILRDAGRTMADLDKAIGVIRYEQGLRAEVQQDVERLESRVGINERIAAANAELQAAQARHASLVNPLLHELQQIGYQHIQSQDARQRLRELELMRNPQRPRAPRPPAAQR